MFSDSSYDKFPLSFCQKDENGNVIKPNVSMTKSTMTRASETGDIIHSHLPHLDIKSCDLLREGAPCPPEPPTKKGKMPVLAFFTVPLITIKLGLLY